ncbi:hypothetical protein JT05_06725 [Desulfosporosinus sp. Tol-M]|nr:hypothetical protein JT05_06725 [Desulfosporosinus sp. Tol-M]
MLERELCAYTGTSVQWLAMVQRHYSAWVTEKESFQMPRKFTRTFSLPLYPWLTDNDVEDVLHAVKISVHSTLTKKIKKGIE